jgi:site-specific DNA recombinase
MTEQSAQPGRRVALEAASKRASRERKRPVNQSSRSTLIAFLYLRVSTREQARVGGGVEGYSIPAQRAAGTAKAAELGAVVHGEYVDAGESARSAQRDQLQKMLADIKKVRPDYVIVHKIDRLARNREDDIAINLLLRKHGVKLVSCMENIDETPQGKLLYGLLAEIAQFYSGNLAQEVMKGLLAKAEEGGTPFRAPLGYVNRREARDGVERSWVELDPGRADIIRWCFEQYATGEWSGIDLTIAAGAKGLTIRATPKQVSRPISITTMYGILANPYYMGVVSYKGVHYEGKHPALVEPEVWLAVQDNLAAHNHRGEKDRKYPHYLRSTIYCSDCGGRLVYSRNTGRGGTYEYFMCVKRKTKTNNCTRPAVRVEKVEAGIATFYTHFRIHPSYVEQIRSAVRAELASQRQEASLSLSRARKRQREVLSARQKLLSAHYADVIPHDVLASEMSRFTRELAEVDVEIQAAKITSVDVEKTLAAALQAAANCQQAYLTAPDRVRRQINQGFFRKLLIGEDGSVERAEFAEPFAALLDTEQAVFHDEQTIRADATPPQMSTDDTNNMGATAHLTSRIGPSSMIRATFEDVTQRTQKTTERTIARTPRGLQQQCLVGVAGFEPTTSSSRSNHLLVLRGLAAGQRRSCVRGRPAVCPVIRRDCQAVGQA